MYVSSFVRRSVGRPGSRSKGGGASRYARKFMNRSAG